jgi:uncharacterized protein
VNDFAEVIGPREENQLTQIIQELEEKTSVEIAVVSVSTIEPYADEKEYAVRLFEKWGIGKKEKDNGILILLALKERVVRIEVGYGLEGVLPDGLCGEIIRQIMVPFFKRGQFGAGFLAGVSRISQILAKEYKIQLTGQVKKYYSNLPPRRRKGGGLLKLIFLIFFIMLAARHPFLALLLLGGGGRRGGFWSDSFRGGGFGGGSFGGFGGGLSGGGGASSRF